MKMMSLTEAEKLRDLRNSVIVTGSPLRYRPVIVPGPRDNEFCVMTLGEANKAGFLEAVNV